MNTTLRPATRDDARPAAELIALSEGVYGDHALGFGDRQRSLRLLEGLFKLKGNRFSFDCTSLVMVDDKIAGLLLAFPGNQYFMRNLKLAWQIPRVLGLIDTMHLALHSLASLTGKETEGDEFYVAQVATHPDFQRRGIGRLLMAYAEKLAGEAHFEKVSLIVELDNELAYALYLKIGFAIKDTVHTPQLAERLHTWGFHRMVKNITKV